MHNPHHQTDPRTQFFSWQQPCRFLHARIAQTVLFTRKTKSYWQKMTPLLRLLLRTKPGYLRLDSGVQDRLKQKGVWPGSFL